MRQLQVNLFSNRSGYVHLAVIVAVIVLVTSAFLFVKNNRAHAPDDKTVTTETAKKFDKTKYPTDKAGSLWVVVNKGRVLPSSYAPADLVVPSVRLRLAEGSAEMRLRQEAASNLVALFEAAKKDRLELMLASGYRPYGYQKGLYSGYVQSLGQAAADKSSARAGHSEHQAGLAADIGPASRKCEIQECFGDLPEGKWLAKNAHKHGFIIRYPKEAQNRTGYEYEPWHLRYVGKQLAAELYSEDLTMEEFFGLPAFTDYPARLTELF